LFGFPCAQVDRHAGRGGVQQLAFWIGYRDS
jgi:hypothetical protein